uniref:Uncharacterized protein n=1 Tax=Arundo donax TaxID=35708 RepID=A0A0A9CXA9_ARUDO
MKVRSSYLVGWLAGFLFLSFSFSSHHPINHELLTYILQ